MKADYGNELALADVASVPYTQWELPEDESIQFYTLLAVGKSVIQPNPSKYSQVYCMLKNPSS